MDFDIKQNDSPKNLLFQIKHEFLAWYFARLFQLTSTWQLCCHSILVHLSIMSSLTVASRIHLGLVGSSGVGKTYTSEVNMRVMKEAINAESEEGDLVINLSSFSTASLERPTEDPRDNRDGVFLCLNLP